ncbi:MAG: hypothetical protein ISR65_10900 [Bacteriovoracaceae bacterium]|nr:hypothetical protein [Bacteriovoracaceae bacterium]
MNTGRDVFLRHIIKKYKGEDVDAIAYLSHKINGHFQQDIFLDFFRQLDIHKKALNVYQRSFKKTYGYIIPQGWANGTWASVYADKKPSANQSSFTNFMELAESLPYYQDLGINVLYVRPFYSCTQANNQGYDIENCLQSMEVMGGVSAFETFMDRANQAKIQVLIDFTPTNKSLQQPDIVSDLLKVLAFWTTRGVKGIKANALHRWIQLHDNYGEHREETFALMEYLNRFLKMLRQDLLFLPEVVDASQNAVRFLGREGIVNGSKAPLISNALINYNKSIEILYACVSGNFISLTHHYKENAFLYTPKGSVDVIYNTNYRDEIFLSLLGAYYPDYGHVEFIREDFRAHITQAKGTIYENGNCATASVTNLMEKSPERIKSFYKFLFAHYGTINLNSWPKGLAQDIYKYLTMLSQAKSKSIVLCCGTREEPLSTMRQNIGSFVRRTRNEYGHIQGEVAVLKNGNDGKTEVNVSTHELTYKDNFKLFEIEQNEYIDFNKAEDGSYITIKLKPHETLWMKVE